MKLTPIKVNMTQIELKDIIVLFSYQTPVAYVDKSDNTRYETNKKWSKTTTRHINHWWTSLWPSTNMKEIPLYKVDQAYLDGVI